MKTKLLGAALLGSLFSTSAFAAGGATSAFIARGLTLPAGQLEATPSMEYLRVPGVPNADVRRTELTLGVGVTERVTAFVGATQGPANDGLFGETLRLGSVATAWDSSWLDVSAGVWTQLELCPSCETLAEVHVPVSARATVADQLAFVARPEGVYSIHPPPNAPGRYFPGLAAGVQIAPVRWAQLEATVQTLAIAKTEGDEVPLAVGLMTELADGVDASAQVTFPDATQKRGVQVFTLGMNVRAF